MFDPKRVMIGIAGLTLLLVGSLVGTACTSSTEEGEVTEVTPNNDGSCEFTIDDGKPTTHAVTHKTNDERFCSVVRVGDTAEMDDGSVPDLTFSREQSDAWTREQDEAAAMDPRQFMNNVRAIFPSAGSEVGWPNV